MMWEQVRREKCRTGSDKKPGNPEPYAAGWTSNRNRNNDHNQKPQSEIYSRRVMPTLCLITGRDTKRPQQASDCFTYCVYSQPGTIARLVSEAHAKDAGIDERESRRNHTCGNECNPGGTQPAEFGPAKQNHHQQAGHGYRCFLRYKRSKEYDQACDEKTPAFAFYKPQREKYGGHRQPSHHRILIKRDVVRCVKLNRVESEERSTHNCRDGIA